MASTLSNINYNGTEYELKDSTARDNIGDISLLETDNKDDLVSAINEARKGSSQNAYELPVATAETLGGVMPSAVTEEMTQEVGVDDEGKLFTKPGGSNGDKKSHFPQLCRLRHWVSFLKHR